jgi:uncharacterized membrane protein
VVVIRFLRAAAGPVFVLAGGLHFLRPKWYRAIMPDYLPAHRELVAASGAAEIAGGVLLLAPSPRVRRLGAWWLVATLVAVFPANVHMALHPDRYKKIPRAALWARLPFQGVFVAWVLAASRRGA